MPRGDCGGEGARQPCCRRRGGGGGALVEPAALAALLYAGGYGYDMRRTILDMTDGEVDVDVGGLYRSLRRLEDEGAVASRWCEDASGPRRREYELTEQVWSWPSSGSTRCGRASGSTSCWWGCWKAA